MADNPNQIDISLSLLGNDSPAVLTSLTQTLQDIAKTMEGVRGALPGAVEGSWSPIILPTADGAHGSRPTAATAPGDAATQPSLPPDAETVRTYTTSPLPEPPTPGSYDDTRAKQKLAAYREANPVQEGVSLPQRISNDAQDYFQKVGQFITQPVSAMQHEVGGIGQAFREDPLGLTGAMGSSMKNYATSTASGIWNGIRGVDPNAAPDDQPGRFQQAKNMAINLAGAPWVMQNIEKFLPSTLPMLVHPNQMTQWGGSTGRDTMGSQVGPFTIPFTSSAGNFAAKQALTSAWEGLMTPGLSGKDILNMRKNLTALGWSNEGDLNHIVGALKPIMQHEKGLDAGTTAAMFDKSIRWGGHSLKEFTDTLRAMAPAARASKMELNEFQKAVSDAAGAATQAGADYLTGVRNATTFSQMSGLPPQLYGQFLQNPWVQANLMGTTGALPWEQGLLSPDTTMMSGLNAANMLTDTFMNARPGGLTYRDAAGRKQHLSSFQLGTAGAAKVLGMSPQELRKLENNRKLLPARARAFDDLNNYAKDARAGHGDDAWQKIQNEIVHGRYIPNDQHGREMRRKLADIYNSTKGHPEEREKKTKMLLEDLMKKAPGTTANDNGVVISLSGDAQRYFRLNDGKIQVKRKSNAGGPDRPNTIGVPGTPSPDTFDPFRVGGAYGGK